MVTDAASTPLPQPDADAYRLRVEVAPDPADPASEVRFRVKEGDGAFATVGVDFASGVAFVARDADAAADGMPEVYRQVRTAPAAVRDGVVTLDIIVDASSVEVFVNDGEAVLSSVVFGAPGANGTRGRVRRRHDRAADRCGSRRSRSRRSTGWSERLG